MKNKKLKIGIISVLFISIVAIGIVTGYTLHLSNKAQQAVTSSRMDLDRGEKSNMRDSTVNPLIDNISVLFIGIDDSKKRNKEDKALSDALILATFNDDDKSIKMISIPRDSYVQIPKVGYKDKITHAHAFGGIDATVETVEYMFNIPVDYYVRLNFDSFIDVVDALNGITYDVPFDIKELDSNDKEKAIELTEGYQKLNGEQALALARTRKYDNDLERGQRQMDLIQSIVQKAKSRDSFTNYGDVIESIGNHMKTNMKFNEILAFKDYFLSKEELQFNEMQLEGKGGKTNGVWYYNLNEESLWNVKLSLRKHLGLEVNQEEKNSRFSSFTNEVNDKDEAIY